MNEVEVLYTTYTRHWFTHTKIIKGKKEKGKLFINFFLVQRKLFILFRLTQRTKESQMHRNKNNRIWPREVGEGKELITSAHYANHYA